MGEYAEGDRPATIKDFRELGIGFGLACADKAIRDIGIKSPQVSFDEIAGGMAAMKEAQLREIGATDDEIIAFMESADEAMRKKLDDMAEFGDRFLEVRNILGMSKQKVNSCLVMV